MGLLKLIVFLICICTSTILCFITSLFIKKQNVLVDIQCQFRQNQKTRSKRSSFCIDEEMGECEELSAECCEDKKTSRPTSTKGRPGSGPSYCDEFSYGSEDELEGSVTFQSPRQTLNERNCRPNDFSDKVKNNRGKKGFYEEEKDRNNRPNDFSDKAKNNRVKKGFFEEERGSRPDDFYQRDRQDDRSREGSQRSKPRSGGSRRSHKAPRTPNGNRSVNFYEDLQQDMSFSTCNSEVEHSRPARWTPRRNYQEKNLDCLLLLNSNQKNPQFSVVPIEPTKNPAHEKQTLGNGLDNQQSEKKTLLQQLEKSELQNQKEDSPDMTKTGSDESQPSLRNPPQTTDKRRAQTSERKRLQTSKKRRSQQASVRRRPNTSISGKPRLHSKESLRMTASGKWKVMDSNQQHLQDVRSQMNMTSISKHNLEKLREKRKERKRTLLKLQYESGKLQDGIQQFFSGESSSDLN